MHTRVTRCLTLILLLLPLLGAWAADLKLPTWPQRFQLALGERAVFGIPVTQAGEITVTVNWQGKPLDIALVNMAGRTVALQPAKAAPTATLTYRASAADVAGGPVWAVRLSAPKGTPERDARANTVLGAAQGTVTATYPEVQLPAVQQAFTTAQSAQTTLRAKLSAPANTPAPTTLMAVPVEKNRAQRLQSQQRTLTARFTTSAGLKPPRQPITLPTVMSVMPPTAMANDHIFINVVCVTANENNEVAFKAGNSWYSQKPVRQTKQADDSLLVEAVVPALVGPNPVEAVRVDAYDRTPMVSTSAVPFKVTRSASPEIVSYTPNPPASNKAITVNCMRLTPGAKLHFKMPDGLEYVPAVQTVVGQQIKATVPAYAITDPRTMTMWAVNSDGVLGQTVSVTLPANQPVIAGVDRASGEPGETVLITGKNLKAFNYINVAFEEAKPVSAATKIYTPTSGCSKTTERWHVVNFNDTQILAVIPPTMGGFTGPISGKLTIRGDAGLVAYTPFTINPLAVTLPLMPAKVAKVNVEYHRDYDEWKEYNKSYSGLPVWVTANHWGDFFEGFSGNDYYEVDSSAADYFFCRENGWKVDRGDVISVPTILNTFGTTAGAYCWSAGASADTKRFYLNVRWWADCHTCIYYYGTIYLRGYQGVPLTQPK